MWWLEETVPNFNGFNISALKTDEAWLNISSTVEQPLWMYSLSEDCHTCSFQKFLDEPILHNHSYKAVVNTQYGVTFRLRTSGEFNYTPSINDSLDICDFQAKLGEFGVYSILIHRNDPKAPVQCSIINELDQVNTFLPIVVTFLFWLLIGIILRNFWKHSGFVTYCFKCICLKVVALFTSNFNRNEDENSLVAGDEGNREPEGSSQESLAGTSSQRKAYKRRKRSMPNSTKNEQVECKEDVNEEASKPSSSNSTVVDASSPALAATQSKRLMSLDAFRGLCIIIMIFADDRGGGYHFFQHSTWDGLYVADLAFPWFIWICGTSIPFTLHSRFSRGTSRLKVFEEVVVRSLKLILLGIMVNTSTRATAVQLENLRLPGVLQRFGICYLIGSTLLLIFDDSGRSNFQNEPILDQPSASWKNYLCGFKRTILPWVVVVICVGLHTAMIFLLPVPDCPMGYLGPAGLHNDSAFPPNCVGGAAGYIDRLIFGIKHIHNKPTSKRVYGSAAFDPEGALGILTSVLHIWLGVQAGKTVLTYTHVKPRVIRLLSWSIITGIGGFILCGGVSNSGSIPVNKNLWSLSFVLITSSAAFAILLMLYVLIDVQRKWSGSPLIETGRNSILLYLGHEVFHAMVPWHFSYGDMVSHTSKLMETCWGTMLWMIIAVYLHDRQLFFVV